MITEDYVSFKVAKLLKEKGFDVPTHTFYNPKKSHLLKFDPCLINRNAGVQVSAPTHQMVMKWLREVHKIIITIDFDKYELTSDNKKVGYGWNIQKIENPTEYFKISIMVYDTYEETCEEAIKYCLENLVTN